MSTNIHEIRPDSYITTRRFYTGFNQKAPKSQWRAPKPGWHKEPPFQLVHTIFIFDVDDIKGRAPLIDIESVTDALQHAYCDDHKFSVVYRPEKWGAQRHGLKYHFKFELMATIAFTTGQNQEAFAVTLTKVTEVAA